MFVWDYVLDLKYAVFISVLVVQLLTRKDFMLCVVRERSAGQFAVPIILIYSELFFIYNHPELNRYPIYGSFFTSDGCSCLKYTGCK